MGKDSVRLSDVRSMRAMAHPLRMRILGSLRLDGPATASMLARRLSTDSGQTSFHLRQLARYGFVEDAPELGKGPRGRERWWKAAHVSTTWDDLSALGQGGASALSDFELAAQEVWAGMLSDYLGQASRGEWSQEWTDATHSGDHLLRATPDGLKTFVLALYALIDEHSLGAEAPDDAEQVILLIHAFPRRHLT